MFGLLRPVSFELPLTAGRAWSSVVCSTCVRLGAEFGALARLAAGPDTALLAALCQAQTDMAAPTALHYCPFRAGPAFLWRGADHAGTRFAAAVSLLAAAARLEDHVRDGDSLPVPRFLASRLARRWATAAQQAAAALDFDTRPLRRQIASQRRRERQRDRPVAFYADPTAFCFGEVFAHTARLSGRPENVEPLRRVGSAFGRQVYLLDAVADLAEDRRLGRFNPLPADAAGAAAWLAEAQHSLESHLARVTLPQPEWVRPVLVDSLRDIGRQRLRCNLPCAAAAAEPTPPPDDRQAEDRQAERRRRLVTFWATVCGTVAGLALGGGCGFCCDNCHRQCDKSGPNCRGCDCNCRR